MKAIFTVSGFIKLPGKTIPYAKQQNEMIVNERSIDADIVSFASFVPSFPLKEALLIDEYQKEVRIEGEITNELSFQVVAILNAKGFTQLDLSNCIFSDDAVASEVLISVLDSLKTNFEVLEIKLPLNRQLKDAEQDKLNECLLRNKSMRKIMPWYSNPIQNASPAKLLLSFTVGAFLGSWIGLGVISLFLLTSLYMLTAALVTDQKEKNLRAAWLRDKYFPDEKSDAEKNAILLGKKSRADWRSFFETLSPTKENSEACRHYPAYLVGAVQAEMDKKRPLSALPAPVVDVENPEANRAAVAPK